MKFATVLLAVFVVMISSTEAWWGRGFGGGFGFRPWGLGGFGYGLGYGGLYGGGLYGGGLYGGYPYAGLGYGYGLYGRSAEVNKESRVECIIAPTKNTMSCDEGKVECEVSQRLDHVETIFDMFGIEFVENKSFRLYPKLFTDSAFGDYRVRMTNGSTAELSLFASGSEARGLMVKDPVCFGKIVDLFRLVKSPVKADVAFSKTQSSKVVISGFVLEI
jgi:hypothetical protein